MYCKVGEAFRGARSLYAHFVWVGRAAGLRLYALSRGAVVQGDMIVFEICFDVIVLELGRGVEGILDAVEPCVVLSGRGRLGVAAAGTFAAGARENFLPCVYLAVRDVDFLSCVYIFSSS